MSEFRSYLSLAVHTLSIAIFMASVANLPITISPILLGMGEMGSRKMGGSSLCVWGQQNGKKAKCKAFLYGLGIIKMGSKQNGKFFVSLE